MTSQTQANTVHIPHSDHTVDVSIIDTGLRMSGLPMSLFSTPDIAGNELMNGAPSYTFLIKHHNPSHSSRDDKLLFDLGVRKDHENFPDAVKQILATPGITVNVEKNVYDVLKEQGEDPADIGAIIWSHHHMDHTGDPSVFPSSVDLIVGQGFKDHVLPAWPADRESTVDSKAWEGRKLRELSFTEGPNTLKLGGYHALDFYGDGSLYLLFTPGHTHSHICALARTKAGPDPEFIFMGGDIAHHGSEFRPSQLKPLPETIQPNPLVAPFAKAVFACPGAIFTALHPSNSSTEPFVKVGGVMHDDIAGAQETIEKLFPFDALDNVFTVIAHDSTLLDIVDLHPKTANEWRAKGWGEQARWRFLRDFNTGVDGMQPR